MFRRFSACVLARTESWGASRKPPPRFTGNGTGRIPRKTRSSRVPAWVQAQLEQDDVFGEKIPEALPMLYSKAGRDGEHQGVAIPNDPTTDCYDTSSSSDIEKQNKARLDELYAQTAPEDFEQAVLHKCQLLDKAKTKQPVAKTTDLLFKFAPVSTNLVQPRKWKGNLPVVGLPPKYLEFLEQYLESTYQLRFSSRRTLIQAFTHRSYPSATSTDKGRASTSDSLCMTPFRYIGQMVLQMYLTSWLMQVWPRRSSEEYRTIIECWRKPQLLGPVALYLGLPQLVLSDAAHAVENSFMLSVFTPAPYSLKPTVVGQTGANDFATETLEAFVGALYLDSGMEKTSAFLEKRVLTPLVTETPTSVFVELRRLWQQSKQNDLSQPPEPRPAAASSQPSGGHQGQGHDHGRGQGLV